MEEKITLPNEFLLSRVSQTIKDGKVAVIPVKGQSMFPFIRGDRDRVELHSPLDLKVGDVVLAEVCSKHYLLHRIFRFEGERRVILMGDGNTHTESCYREDIRAKALIVITKEGKRKRLDSQVMKSLARLWKFCLPVRRLLLKIFRELFFWMSRIKNALR